MQTEIETLKRILYNFLYKYLFILKAASDGYIVKYIGGNQYEFKKCRKESLKTLINNCTPIYNLM